MTKYIIKKIKNSSHSFRDGDMTLSKNLRSIILKCETYDFDSDDGRKYDIVHEFAKVLQLVIKNLHNFDDESIMFLKRHAMNLAHELSQYEWSESSMSIFGKFYNVIRNI